MDRDRVPIPGAPDIVVEVISPTERTSDSDAKVHAYLRNGAREVWQVQIHRVDIGRSVEVNQPLTTDLLPGFALQLTSLFE